MSVCLSSCRGSVACRSSRLAVAEVAEVMSLLAGAGRGV